MFYFVMDINPLEYNNYLDSDIEKIEMCEELNKIAINKYDENIVLMINDETFKCENTLRYMEYASTNGCLITDAIYLVNNNVTHSYNSNLVNILKDANYNSKYLDSYIKYLQENDVLVSEAISKVNEENKNIKTNTNKYQVDDTYSADTSKGLFILVNKKYYVGDNYTPDNLVSINSKYTKSGKGRLVKEAADAFEVMCEAALLDNIVLKNVSAYRTYQNQVNNWTYYVKRDGEDKASTYSARPGYSEHHTGLATDINTPNDSFVNTKEYE